MKKYILILCVFVAVACKTQDGRHAGKTYSGLLEVQGITTYQYGTHTLKTDSETYALKSDSIILDDFNRENVVITAELVKGYPVDGGPAYLNVVKIELKN